MKQRLILTVVSVALILGLLGIMLATRVMAAGGAYYLRGDQCGWDPGCSVYDDSTNGDQFSGDYIHSLNYTANAADQYKFYRSDTGVWFPTGSGNNLTFDSTGSCPVYMLAQGNPYGITINDGNDPYAAVACDAAQQDFSAVSFIGNQDFSGATQTYVDDGNTINLRVEIYAAGLTNAGAATSGSAVQVQLEYHQWDASTQAWDSWATYGTGFTFEQDNGSNWQYLLSTISFTEGIYELRAKYTDWTGATGNTGSNTKILFVSDPSNTNHSITIDGTSTDWRANESLGTVGSGSAYVTWDERYLYVRFSNGFNETDQLHIAIDTNPGTNDLTGASATPGFSGATFAGYLTPDYLVRSLNNTNLDKFTRSGTSWGSSTSIYAGGANLWRPSSGTGTAELRIPRAELGNLAPSSAFGLYIWWANSGGTMYAAYGVDNPQTGGRMRTATVWSTSGTGQAPSTTLYSDHNNSETRTIGVATMRHLYVSNGIGTIAGDKTINGNVTLANGGTLRLDNTGTGRSLTISGNITIDSGGVFDTATGGSATTHSLTLGGDLTNDGTFDCLPAANRIINVTFNNSSADQTISGASPILTRFNKITLDKGAATRKVIASISIAINGVVDSITWTNGTWEQNAGTLTFSSGGQTLTANGNLTINGSGSMTVSNGSYFANGGTLTVDTSGTVNLGASTGNRLEINGGTVEFKAGIVNIGGRVGTSTGSGLITNGILRLQGATVNVPSVGLNNSSTGVFMIGTSAAFEMSGGTLNILTANQGTFSGNDVDIRTGTISGGTIVMGSASPGTQDFLARFDVALSHLIINASGRTVQLQNSAPTVNGNLTISAGTLDANNLDITLAGNWTNTGTFTAGSGTVTFNGLGTQTYGGASTTTFNDLTVNSGATLDVGTNTLFNVSGTLTNHGTLKQTKSTPMNTTTSFLNVSTNKYYGVDIYPTTGSMGETTVSVSGNQTCPKGSDAVKRCFDITPGASGQTANITLYYLDTEENGQAAANIWHWNGGSWDGPLFTSRVNTGANRSVTANGASGFSPFALSNNDPTAVTLASFTAMPTSAGILLEWETATELDNVGFNLYRAESLAGPRVQLNDSLIPTQEPGSVWGAVYQFADDNAIEGVTYLYWLEDVDIHGRATLHGPVTALAGDSPTALTLRAASATSSNGYWSGGLLGLLVFVGAWWVWRRRQA